MDFWLEDNLGIGDDSETSTSWMVVGLSLIIFGAYIDNLGVTFMKISHLRQTNVRGKTEMVPAYFWTRQWLSGFVFFIIGNILNVIGLSYAPQSLFAALGGLSLVWNAINAHMIIKELITRRILFGTVLVVGGSSLSVLFGSSVQDDFTVEGLLDRAKSGAFLIYLGSTLGMLIFTMVIMKRLEKKLKTRPDEQQVLSPRTSVQHQPLSSITYTEIYSQRSVSPPQPPSLGTEYPIESGTSEYLSPISEPTLSGSPEPHLKRSFDNNPHPNRCNVEQGGKNDSVFVEKNGSVFVKPVALTGSAVASVHRSLMMEVRGSPYSSDEKWLSFSYPFVAGLIGSYTVLLAKSATVLLNTSLDGPNQFTNPITYFVIVVALIGGIAQIHWLNRGLYRYDQLVIIPTFNVCYSFFSIVNGGIFFREFRYFNLKKWLVFPFSVLITFIGVYFITVLFGTAHTPPVYESKDQKTNIISRTFSSALNRRTEFEEDCGTSLLSNGGD